MQVRPRPTRLAQSLAAAALAAPMAASAVSLDPDGRGQALIYPYYTVQSADGNAFNTYISVMNHSRDSDKALRVRFRESRNGREVASLNIFLGRNDVWTAAIIPEGAGARLITRDASCTEPLLWPGQFPGLTADGLAFGNAAFGGANADGAGEGLDRTREGYIEILEMATVNNAAPGNLQVAITHTAVGMPANCGSVQPANLATTAPAGTFGAPSGGLSGTLTLINVANGMDFSLRAEALAQVASRPYFRTSADTYPSFSAAEVDPVSLVTNGAVAYRSTWTRGVDAVSAALMRRDAAAEWTREEVTASQTDFVFTFPTRPHYLQASVSLPFSSTGWSTDCGARGPASGFIGEQIAAQFFNRNQAGATISFDPPLGNSPPVALCATAAVAPVSNGGLFADAPSLLGSQSFGVTYRAIPVRAGFQHGLLAFTFLGGARPDAATMVSEPDSTRIDLVTGQFTTGRHTFRGLPVTGFAARTLRNGTLSCNGGSCQGNYGSAFPFTYQRDITGS